MTQINIDLKDIKPSDSNVRSNHTKEDIQMMATSINTRGIINPLSVAKNGDGKYEIIAGLLRYKGALKAGIKQVPCEDMTNLTPSERVDLSLSENAHRKSMTVMQSYAAFSKLFKSGMSIETIADRHDKTDREVQQLLAIGDLPKKIHELYESEEIGGRTLKALAIASTKDIARYCKLKTDKDRPRDWEIQKWLAGDKGSYLSSNAMFDLSKYKGPQIVDLFGEEGDIWLTDGTQFTTLQNEWIEEQTKLYISRGWSVTEVEHFHAWIYDKTSKANGGKVYWTRQTETGEVNFHIGYLPQKKSGATAAKKKGSAGKPEAKPETSKAFDNYMSEVRHAYVQRVMVDCKPEGLVATLILLLKQCDNISFREMGNGLSDEYRKNLNNSNNFLVVRDKFREMLKEIGLKNGHTRDMNIETVGAKLMNESPTVLTKWIITTVAFQWNCEGNSGDKIGKAIGIADVGDWETDTTFWNGIKNKQTLIKIAKQNKIPINILEPVKVIRASIVRSISDTWLPKWLQF